MYFECKIQANPKLTRLVWLFNVSWLLINIFEVLIFALQRQLDKGTLYHENY